MMNAEINNFTDRFISVSYQAKCYRTDNIKNFMKIFLLPLVGWVYLVIVLDWHTRKIIGYHIDIQSKTPEWKDALHMAVNTQCPDGSRNYDIHLMSDNGSQPTSTAFMKACDTLNIKQAFTSYNNPEGNANTERVIRTIKEDCIWINEWFAVDESQQCIAQWIHDYNHLYAQAGVIEEFQEKGIRYHVRLEPEKPMQVSIQSTVNLIGLPASLLV